jgi:hypothetical protein
VDFYVEALKSFHRQSYDRKDANKLISPAIFNPNHPKAKGETKRGLNNIVTIRSLRLDFENGQLHPQQVPDLFPLTKLLIFNSYNHSRKSPRFRVVFPFDQSLGPEEYIILYDNIIAKIADAGYSVGPGKTGKPSGLDISKKTPASLFYLPCQAKNPADSFFLDCYHDETRKLLEPKLWIEHSVVPFPKKRAEQRPRRSPPDTIDQANVDEAKKLWRQSKDHPGEGARDFGSLLWL